MEILLEPDIAHCIQTLARKEHDRMVDQLLATGEATAEIEQRLETLRSFLESTDFGKLRGEYEPFLVQGKKVTFRLRPGKNQTEYEMEVQ